MRQSHVDFVSEPASSYAPKIVAAFVIGTAATFAGALMFTTFQQRLRSVGAVNASALQSIAAPAEHVVPAEPNQQIAESSMGDQQQQTAATGASTHEPLTAPDHITEDKPDLNCRGHHRVAKLPCRFLHPAR